MPRPFRVLAVGVALVLATLGTATSASATPSPGPPGRRVAAAPPLPDSMAAIGDSITQAVDVCCFYGNWPGHSWSTGNVPARRHRQPLRAPPGPEPRHPRPPLEQRRLRRPDGRRPRPGPRTVGQGAQYVTILMGANDLCGWDGTLTPTATFRAQFTETLDILRTGLPATHVFVASIPNLYQLWSILRTDPVAQTVWQAAGICPSMLNFFNSAADRQAVIDREAELNQVLEDVCATWSNCRFDNYLTYNYAFTRSMVSKLDYFHPSLTGQATLATLTWNASWWGS